MNLYKHVSTALLLVCVCSFAMAISDILKRMQFTALDYSIIGMVSLLIAAGANSDGCKEQIAEEKL